MHNAKRKGRKSRKKLVRKSVAHKLRSVRLVLDGFSAVVVGKKYGNSARAVSYWVTRFKESGRRGLSALPHPGRPSKLSASQMEKIRNYVSQAKERGERVTGDSLSRFIKKSFRIKITRQHCRRLLNRYE